jgi:hypothetical protein
MIKLTRKYRELVASIKSIKEEDRTEEQSLLLNTYSNVLKDLETKTREDKNSMEDVFNFLYGGHSWTKVKKEFESDFKKCRSAKSVNDVYNKYIPYIWLNRAFSTAIGKYTDFRKTIEELNTKESKYALDTVFSIGDENKEKGVFAYRFNKSSKKVIKDIEENKSDFTPTDTQTIVNKLIDYVDNFDDRVKEGKISVYRSANKDIIKAYYISFLLGITTGRRQFEILKSLEIGSKRGTPTFRGLGKLPKEQEGKALEGKILFISIKDAQKYLRLLRKLLPTQEMTNVAVNKKYNGMFNKAFKDRFVNSELNILKDGSSLFSQDGAKFHRLRTAYALTAYKMAVIENEKLNEDKREKIYQSKFIADVLHQVWKKNASDHYDKEL